MNKFYVYNGNHSELIREGLLRRENWVEERHKSVVFSNCQFIWKPCNLSLQGYTKLDAIARSRHKPAIQVFNHFENIRGICTKTGLVRSLKKYYRANKEASKVGYTVFDSLPTSFLITAGVEDHEHSQFVSRFRDLDRQIPDREKTPLKHCLGNVWLVKPANENQGRGIKVFRNLKDIHNFLNSRALHSFWVVQKYIEKPLLYFGRKFDIRVWVVVTHKHEVFMYKKAYIRTSSDSYDLNNKNNYVHLTNNCLQQHGQNYGKHEDGNTLPLEILDQYFETAYPEKNVKLETHIIPRIKDLIIDTILCSKAELNPLHRPHIFEFFGYDFMIDEDLRTWLIEVNTNPYLGTPNEYIGNLLPKFVDDMLDITVDHLIPPKTNPRGDRPNDFEIIYCENNSQHNQGPLNVRSPFTQSLYPVPEFTPSDFIKKQEAFQKRKETPPKPKPLYFTREVRPVDREPKTTREKGTALVTPTKLNQKINPNQTFPSPIPEADIYNVEDGIDNQTPTQDHAPGQEDLDEITKEENTTLLDKRSGSVPANILEEEFTDTDGDDDVLLEDELTEDSSDELDGDKDPTTTTAKKRKGRRLKKSKSKKKNIESIYKSLHLACIYKTSIDINVLSKELNLVLGSLKNWELISEKKIRISNKALKLISQSNANYLFTTPRVVDVLSRLLKSPNVGLDIKLAIVEAIGFVAKDENLKRKLIHTRIVHELIRICLYSCDPSEIQNYSKLFFVTTLKCLINLGVAYFKKPQSQSEAKEFEKLKASFMGQGAVIAIWLVAYHSLDSSLKEIAFRNFLTSLQQNTLEKQIELLDLLKIIPEADSENEDSDDEDNIGGGPSGLVSVADMAKEKGSDFAGKSHNSSIIAYEAVLRTTINMRQTDRGASFGSNTFDSENLNSISFPKSLFKLYPLEQLITEFKEYVYCSKDNRGHQEFESKERQILKEIVKLIKQEKKKITTSSPIDANKNSCSPKMYRKLQTKMQKMKMEQQVNAYQNPRRNFSPSVEKELNLSQSTHSKRGVSHDFKKKPPRTIEKLHLGSMARGFVEPDSEFKKTLYKNTSNRGTVPMSGSTTLSPAITAKGGLVGFTSKPPSLTQFDIDPNLANTKSILQTRKTNRQQLPSINPARLSEKKLGSPVNKFFETSLSILKKGNHESKITKTLGSLAEEGTVNTEESTKGPKQLKFIYPTARESELRESLYGVGGKGGFRSGRYDVEAVKLMNSRTNFAKRPSPKRKIV